MGKIYYETSLWDLKLFTDHTYIYLAIDYETSLWDLKQMVRENPDLLAHIMRHPYGI